MNNNRRGFTLAELTVVLAVLVIVSAMVISFTAMVTNSRQLSSARLDALSDVKVAESIIEGFIEGNGDIIALNDGIYVETEGVDENNEKTKNKVLYFEKSEEEQGGTLTTPETSVTLERVNEITFEEHGSADKIYYCTIKYSVGNHEYNYTFCVNPYVGETVGGN